MDPGPLEEALENVQRKDGDVEGGILQTKIFKWKKRSCPFFFSTSILNRAVVPGLWHFGQLVVFVV